MNDKQWKNLLLVLKGQTLRPTPCGFIADSPWLPGWYGVDIVEYLSSETVWLDAVSRGPFNVASFLVGMTEFLTRLKRKPGLVHCLLRVITDFLKSWHEVQPSSFPSIDGIMILDDIVGFVGEKDFVEFALPYLRELYEPDVAVKFFHNDAACAQSIRYYPEIGINLFNPGIQTPLQELRMRSDNRLTILGNIPPLAVLARGTQSEVRCAVRGLLDQTPERSRLILSCAGGHASGCNLREPPGLFE